MRSATAKLERLSALFSAILTAACVREERSETSAPSRQEVCWDFPSTRGQPKLRLWPTDSATPERLKRAMLTESDRGRLSIRVNGKDPYFVWRLREAIPARLVSVEIEASGSGVLELYWSSAACPTFRESCSLTDVLSPGRQWIDFLTDESAPMREIRLDLPDEVGASFWIYNIVIFDRAELSQRWAGREGVVGLYETPSGLLLAASASDPWIGVTTPGLVATRFDTVEIALRAGAPTEPQLFWQGPCAQFDESCSVHLHGADSGALTHSADLSKVPTWRGPITALRLDPAQEAGEYTIEHIALSAESRLGKRPARAH